MIMEVNTGGLRGRVSGVVPLLVGFFFEDPPMSPVSMPHPSRRLCEFGERSSSGTRSCVNV